MKKKITDKNRKNEAIEPSSPFESDIYQSFFMDANDAIFIADHSSGIIVMANKMASTLIGRPIEQIKGMHQSELHPPDKKKMYETIFKNHRENTVQNIYVQHSEDYIIPVEINANIFEYKEKKYIQGIFRDTSSNLMTLQRLKLDEKYFRENLDKAPSGIVVCDIKGNIQYVNSKYIEITGYDMEDIPTLEDWWSLAYPDKKYKEKVKSYWNRAATRAFKEGKEIVPQERTITRKDGTLKDIEFHFSPIGDIGILLFHDVTDRNKETRTLKTHLEQKVTDRTNELQSSLEETDRIFHLSHDLICVLDKNFAFLRANPAFYKTLKLDDDILIEMKFLGFIHTDDRNEVTNALKRLEAGEKKINFISRFTDGQGNFRVLSCSASADRKNNKFYIVARDITERQQISDELHHNYTLLNSVFEGTSDAIYVKDTESKIIKVNKAFTLIFDKPQEAFIGKSDMEFLPKEIAIKIREADLKAMASDKYVTEETIIDKDGQERVYLSTKTPFHDQNGEVIGLIGVSCDITERKKFSESLHLNQKLESMGMLASGISHDFSNVLAIIMNNLELARLNASSKEVIKFIDKAFNAVYNGKDMVENLLAFSSDSVVEHSAINMDKTTRDLLSLMKSSHENTARLRFKSMPGLWMVHGNTSQLQQVLMNLYQNAVDATRTSVEQGQQFTEAYINFELENITHEDTKDGSFKEYVRLSVSDNGCGISDEILPKIFDPFFSTKGAKHSGIGLSASYGIIKQSGGWIDLKREKDKTTFTVFLPKSSEEIIPKPSNYIKGLMGGTETILVVDDDHDIVESLNSMLSALGYSVLQSYSAEDALKVYADKKDEISLIITDLVMPGMSGLELLYHVREITPDISIIVSSGYNNYKKFSNITEKEKTIFLLKPFNYESLSATVCQALGSEQKKMELKQSINKVKLSFIPEKTVPYFESITNSKEVYELFKHLGDESREKFIVLFLDNNKKIIAYDEIAQGTAGETVVYPQEVLKAALLSNSSNIILIHNHPSGQTEPSQEDLALTSEVIKACKLFNIKLLDHIIIGHEGYFAFNAED